ncbi:ferritin-like domain-containing protein [Hymenobacter cavernae]|uniref:Ferritin-like domain-containing protein n=1 Tax=Hymenobacter cavernae TaxID=2044852 RepID=A0ABQ1TKH8_9BACT|nr:ferritin-like domain-containing protein [Hymenobacter cavernae]GGE95569.1 hypothetical protein GCM10011383_02880 [Hymenobacter cavernae]
MTFQNWAAYFRANQHHLDNLSWDDTYQLTEREKRAVRRSVQHFQKGESSAGSHFRQQAQQLGDADYAQTLDLFLQEEHDHAAVLGSYLDQEEMPRLKSHGLDRIFQWLRRQISLENTVRVILTAELIAAVYYRALFQATYSGLLQQICLRILADEEMHINFQCFTLHHLSQHRSRFTNWFVRKAYGVLLLGTILAVWLSYFRTLRAGGYGFFTFSSAVWSKWVWAETMQKHVERITIRGQEPIVLANRPKVSWDSSQRVQPRWAH